MLDNYMDFLVFIVINPPLSLIITEFALQNIITVLSCYVILKTTLCWRLIIALIIRIPDSSMFRLNMSLKISLLCSLIITLITRIPNAFMFSLNMPLKITLFCSLIITLITRIPDAFMFRLNMLLKMTLI